MVNFGVPVFCGQHRSRRVSLKAMLQDPNKWTERDERLLALLLQKRAACDVEGDFGPPSMHVGSPGTGVAEGYGAGNMGAMHDGAKRRLTADTPATSSDWEKLEPTYVGEVIVENDTEEALVAALDASTVGAGGDVHLGPVDLPQGIDSLEMWGKTMMSFGQYKGKYSYIEVATDKSLWDYRKWVRSHINQRTSKGAPLDFASYLRAYDARHGPTKQLPVIPGTSIARTFKDGDP